MSDGGFTPYDTGKSRSMPSSDNHPDTEDEDAETVKPDEMADAEVGSGTVHVTVGSL